jgi:hypothetical protein
VPLDHLLHPPCDAVLRHPIREDSVAGPHSADVLAAVWVGEENTRVVAARVGIVSIASISRVGDIDGSVDNRNKVLVVLVQPPEELSDAGLRECDRVEREVTVPLTSQRSNHTA